MLKRPANDFRYFLKLVVDDVIKIAEMKHSVGAFTALNFVLARSYNVMTGINPFSEINPMGPEKILEWAKANRRKENKYNREPVSEDLALIINIIAQAIELAVNADGASFGYVVGLLACLSRAYYVVNNVDILNNSMYKDTQEKLIKWAWGFKVKKRIIDDTPKMVTLQ